MLNKYYGFDINTSVFKIVNICCSLIICW